MPRKKNKRKAIQALRLKMEVDGIRIPKSMPLPDRVRPLITSDRSMALALSFVIGMDSIHVPYVVFGETPKEPNG